MSHCVALCPSWLVSLIFYFHLESPEGFGAALKAYQSLEPGDFTGFLKLLRSPASKRLQSRCTTFLNTMEAYHVMTSFWLVPNSLWPFRALLIVTSHFLQELPVQKQSDYVQDFFQSFAKYFKGEYISLHVIVYCLSWSYYSVQSWLHSCFQVLLTLRSLR